MATSPNRADNPQPNTTAVVLLASILAIAVLLLRLEGRLWWCACGRWNLWSGNVWSQHNSQHLFDPYSFTHVLHGMVACGLLAYFLPRLALQWRLCIAVLAEATWEVVENTEFVINRYRGANIMFDYHGDTVANSLGDIISFAVGFWLARRIGLRCSIIVFIVTEIVLLICIRDNLLLSAAMLIYPAEVVKSWQLGPK